MVPFFGPASMMVCQNPQTAQLTWYVRSVYKLHISKSVAAVSRAWNRYIILERGDPPRCHVYMSCHLKISSIGLGKCSKNSGQSIHVEIQRMVCYQVFPIMGDLKTSCFFLNNPLVKSDFHNVKQEKNYRTSRMYGPVQPISLIFPT